MVAKINVFVLHWHSLFKLCQWGAFFRHSILHSWFNQGEWLEWPSMYPKNHNCITCINLFSLHAWFCLCITFINSFIAYHKNDLEILIVTTVCSIPKLDRRIERYHNIKFSWSTWIVWGEADHVWLIEINFDWLMIKIN